jgi:hypothetical protein
MPIVLLLCACASSPSAPASGAPATSADPPREEQTSGRSDAVRVQLQGGATFLNRRNDEDGGRMASNFSVGLDRLFSYQASWSIEPGDVLSTEPAANVARQAPTRLGGQQIGQNVALRLPELAGAPMTLAVSSEVESNWLLGGSTQSQRERADLSWSSNRAKVSVQWTGSATMFDDRAALACDLKSSVRLPVHEKSGRSEALRVSGRSCFVPHQGTPYDGTEAQAWGLSYVWGSLKRETEAALSVIDPRWTTELDFQTLRPAYELGLSHRRNFGSLSASGLVSMRQGPSVDGVAAPDPFDGYVSGDQADWSANASLTWQLPEASLSANWAKGIDRLWFTPDGGQGSDRFGLALNLSRWVESWMPASSPQLAMNWSWSEVPLLSADVTQNHSLELDFVLMF